MNDDVRSLFHELADVPPVDRERILQERRIAPEVRAELESLLSFDAASDHRITESVSALAGDVLRSSQTSEPIHCGPYRLLRLLGSGGMGAVYLAERSDGELEQRVAVKLLKAGADRPAWRERFMRERQLLASLNHPSIARVIDAGRTEDDRPYLVMEYVDGTQIDEYTGGLELRERLRLFLRVCDGVSHAHKHLIIHRDLKPSNILVDGAGQPKLLDFGIAKLLDETGESTQTVERLLTPNYASPEQLRGEAQTTATDVYSLGAVLHKLLTGRSPNETGPEATPPALPRDLDFILRQALRADAEERYASVGALADDVRAFLDSMPVRARAGDRWYRTRKFLRRHWIPAAALGLVLASLSVGLSIANRQRAIAERRFSQLRQLSNRVFDLDAAIKDLPGSLDARHRLVTTSLEYLEGLRSNLHADPELAHEVGQGYARVGRIQGVPTDHNLGQFAKAEESLAKADALIESVLGAGYNRRRALIDSAGIAQNRMIVAQSERRREDALAHARKAAQRLEAFLQSGGPSENERGAAATIYTNLALAHNNMRLYGDGMRFARSAVETLQGTPSLKPRLGEALSMLANSLRFQGDLDSALRTIRESRKVAEEAPFPTETGRMMSMYAILSREGQILGEEGGVSLGRPEEAMAPLQKALDITEQSSRKNPNDQASHGRTATAARELGKVLARRDPNRALEVYDLALLRLGVIKNNLKARRDEALVLALSSYPLRRLRRAGEAKERIDRALAILAEAKDYPGRVTLESEAHPVLRALADHYAEQGNPQRATEVYEQLLEKITASKPDVREDLRDATRMSGLYGALGALYQQIRHSAAEDMAARRLELWRHWERKLPGNRFVSQMLAAAAQ